jgi:hypothetical protein
MTRRKTKMTNSIIMRIQSLQTLTLASMVLSLLSSLTISPMFYSMSSLTWSSILFWRLTSYLNPSFSNLMMPTTSDILSNALSWSSNYFLFWARIWAWFLPFVFSNSPSASLCLISFYLYISSTLISFVYSESPLIAPVINLFFDSMAILMSS